MKVLKYISIVIAFVLAQRAHIEQFIQDAETAFPEVGSGLQKLDYVLGRVFTYAADIESDLAKVPPEDVAALLSGHISQIVAKLLPSTPAAAAPATS